MHRPFVRLGALALSSAALAVAAFAAPDGAPSKADAAMSDTFSGNLDGEVRHAQLLRAQGDYAGAIRVLSQLMLAAPDDPRVVGEYGKVLVQQGRAGEASDFLKRAVVLQPSDWTLYSALGVAYDEANNSADARAAYERALALKPGESVVLNNYAMSRMMAGDLVQARALMAQASTSRDPKIARNLALLDGLALPAQKSPPKSAALPPVVAGRAPVQTLPAALHAPRPLAAASVPREVKPYAAAAGTVVMQAVPFDPNAGPVAKKPIHVAASPRKPAAPPKLRKTSTQTAAANQIPALRLANERP